MADERLVVLNRSDNLGFGFSLLGEAGLPHIIYKIEENSPAARSGEVEAGDVLLKVNGTDVHRYTTREVLKCLRLSSDPVTIKLKKDPQIKANVKRYLSTTPASCPTPAAAPATTDRRSSTGTARLNHDRSPPWSNSSHSLSSSSRSSSNGLHSAGSGDALLLRGGGEGGRRIQQPKFEAYMMTGELMLNLTRTDHHKHVHSYHRYNSTPASPSEHRAYGGMVTQRHNSTPDTAPRADTAAVAMADNTRFNSQPVSPATAGDAAPRNPHAVRNSKSEDHLQKESSLSAVAVDMEEDVTSSLNTLLDARPDSARSHSDANHTTTTTRDRIVWTYNSAPLPPVNVNGSSTPSSAEGNSRRSSSPASPTSMSSSVMSSRASPPPAHRAPTLSHHNANQRHLNGDMSLSEAVSNISSPDYLVDQDDIFESGRECPRMELSDPSDSDSTILVSETCHRRVRGGHDSDTTLSRGGHDSETTLNGCHDEHRIVIQVKGGPDKHANNNNNGHCQSERTNKCDSAHCDDCESGNSDCQSVHNNNTSAYLPNGRENGHSSPENQGYQELGTETGSDAEWDAESLHSFHYSPKAVDIPSAERLAKRLYHLDGFKKSDVSRHLSKNNEFSRAVAEEYVKHFEFVGVSLDAALRQFLARFALSGETQERERVLVHFSRRYLECNPGTFNSQDAVHTLTCAIMLLNTDLHGGAGGGTFRRMACGEFIANLADLNDGQNFPRDVLKALYHAVRVSPIQWALDTDTAAPETAESRPNGTGGAAGAAGAAVGSNPFLAVPDQARAVEYKKGYVMRKCCNDANGKKTPFGRRGWKMFYCTLRDLVLYLHKDEHGFKRNQMSDNVHNAIRLHHAVATKASDYTKKQHVFRLQTADQAEYLFQTSDSKELCSWVETINFVCATYSAPPLAGAVGSQRKFQRPLLPCTHTKLNMREQLAAHEQRATQLDEELAALRHARDTAPNARDKERYLIHEIKRYRAYAHVMRSRATGPAADDAAPALPERDHAHRHTQPPPATAPAAAPSDREGPMTHTTHKDTREMPREVPRPPP